MNLSTATTIDPRSGLIRLSLAQCRRLHLEHLTSGLDEDAHGIRVCGSRTTFTGYTEWVSTTHPCVTLGWAWRVDAWWGRLRCVRVGAPFGNLLIVDRSGCDYTWRRNLAALAGLVDALAWCESASAAVSRRCVEKSNSLRRGG
jgi:hypothetical protein